MCGIIGYIGSRDSKEILLEGLKKIQYRGYDSMGLVISTDQGFKQVRSVGDVFQLKKKLQEIQTSASTCGLGHSRWATHGVVSEKNAHPHKAEDIYIVHNGIIENAEELKAWLEGDFLSDTDSEVVAHCLVHSQKNCSSLEEAIRDTMSKIKGEYAIAVMSEKHPNEIFAFKKGPSLGVGIGKKELFLCSDPQGFLKYTKKVIFLKDEEIVHLQKEGEPIFYSKKGEEIKKSITLLQADLELESKENYPYYMLKEIHEQPDCVSKILQNHILEKEQRVDLKLSKGPGVLDQILKKGRFNIVACGSSYYAAVYAKYVIEKLSGIAVDVDMASEFRYRSPVLAPETPLLLISQSGETADTLAVLKMAQDLSLPILSLCNVAHSSLDRLATAQFYMLAGVEKAVASSKAFTSSLVNLFLLAVFLGRKNKQLASSEEQKLVQALSLLPLQMKQVLSQEKEYKKAAHLACALNSFIFMGRGLYYPLALEGALKMKELSYRYSAAYPAGEMKHGPLALVDKNKAIVGLAPQSSVHIKTLSNLEEARSRGGRLILVGTEGDKKIQALAECFLPLPKNEEAVSAILCALPLQLMAYHTACALGHNVDQPRNLAKSVTVE